MSEEVVSVFSGYAASDQFYFSNFPLLPNDITFILLGTLSRYKLNNHGYVLALTFCCLVTSVHNSVLLVKISIIKQKEMGAYLSKTDEK